MLISLSPGKKENENSFDQPMNLLAGTKIIRYYDNWSSLALWFRVFFLFPWWVYLLLPIYGAVAAVLGTFIFQVCYISALLAGIFFFANEVLKRKIKIDEELIYFGFRTFELSKLSSVGLVYQENKIVPKKLLLYFGEGNAMELTLTRLDVTDFEMLLNLIENRLPHCSVDPVIGTLTKGKKLARKAALDESDRTEIAYQSRRFLKEVGLTFARTARGWARIGPAIALFFLSPVWLSSIFGLYSSLLAGSLARHNPESLYRLLMAPASTLESNIGSQLNDIGTLFWHAISQPTIIALLIFSLVPVLYHLFNLIIKPNRLILDASGCHLRLSAGPVSVQAQTIEWKEVRQACLSKPSESSGPESWTISLKHRAEVPLSSASLNLELKAISPEDRLRFSKAVQRFAPHCAMDTELAETLLPRQTNSYTELWMQSLAAPSGRANLEPLSAGHLLQDGRFEVIRKLGIGGQGAAYLCEERTMEGHSPATRKVVLKETILPVFVENIVRQQALERFDQEAQLLRDLDNKHIVKFMDYFVEDHRGYLVLEWVDGTSLRQVIENRGALGEVQVTDLCRQMCEMLGYLHQRSIIHRDFTPDNLILQKDGTLKLIDFNVAQQDHTPSSAGIVVGKQAYMPAEQFRGKPSPESDIYAMGATLYFLLTGLDPEPLSQSRIHQVKPQVSDRMDLIIGKCTELDSKKRFSSAKEVAKLLSNQLEPKVIQTVTSEIVVSPDGTKLKLDGNIKRQKVDENG